MPKNRLARVALILLLIFAVLAAAAAIGLHFATRALKAQVETALGPDSEIGDIQVGWSAIEVHKVTLRGPRGWPAEHALRAQRITIAPDLRSLLSDRSTVRVNSITIEGAYLSILRTREGKLRLLPSLLEKKESKDAKQTTAPAIAIAIGNIALHDGVVEFFDASVRHPAHKMRLEKLTASVKKLHLPDLAGRTELDVTGTIKGVRRDGTLAIKGWLELADKNSQLSSHLSGVDLVALQPYLIKAAETGVKRGALDLHMTSTVKRNVLHAPGTVTLSDLELSEHGSTFMGLPRQLVVSSLKDRSGKITIKFSLDGNLADPRFSLNDSFAKSIGTATAGLLGISIEGLTKGVGNAATGVGSLMQKIFGK
ncbi:MAG: DUF748 domain-containing protein [Proteobacteria bacterium]|nr:DUF748 domain-containing protein [Pseudomonadota bacterium]